MRKFLLASALAFCGTFAMANDNISTVTNTDLTTLIDDCYYYEYFEESLTIYQDGSWEYESYFESGIVCD